MDNAITVEIIGDLEHRYNEMSSLFASDSRFKIYTGDVSANNSGTLPQVRVLDARESSMETVKSAMVNSDMLALVVLGPQNNTELMRAAMQAGAKDYLIASPEQSIDEAELLQTVFRLGIEQATKVDPLLQKRGKKGTLTVAINCKGGSGATFISSCLATCLASRNKQVEPVLLLDADIQFGDLPVYFDLQAKDSLLKAIDTVGSLDEAAIDAIASSHPSGIKLLSSHSNQLRSAWDVDPVKFATLIHKLVSQTDHVIVDAPNQLDPIVATCLEQADRILLVTQQSVPHVRGTRQMLRYLDEMGISATRLHLLVNRYQKKSAITDKDLREAFPDIPVKLIPSDYKGVASAVNNGLPFPQKAKSSPVTKAANKLVSELWPIEGRKKRSWFSKSPQTRLQGA